jgi:hypothetical protein
MFDQQFALKFEEFKGSAANTPFLRKGMPTMHSEKQSRTSDQLRGNGAAPPPKSSPFTAEPEPALEPVEKRSSIFEDAAAIEIDISDDMGGGAVEPTSVPVKRPDKHWWFMATSDPSLLLRAFVYTDRDERETYYILPSIRSLLEGFFRFVELTPCITRQGTPFIFPVPLPNDTSRKGGSRSWNDSSRACAERARHGFVRMESDLQAQSYRIRIAKEGLPPPVWPDWDRVKWLDLAFKNKIIDRPDHIIIRQLAEGM